MDRVIIKGDLATVISWIREAQRSTPSHLIIQDIALLLQGCTEIIVCHDYREANFVVDWVLPMLPITLVKSCGLKWMMPLVPLGTLSF